MKLTTRDALIQELLSRTPRLKPEGTQSYKRGIIEMTLDAVEAAEPTAAEVDELLREMIAGGSTCSDVAIAQLETALPGREPAALRPMTQTELDAAEYIGSLPDAGVDEEAQGSW